MQPPKETYKPAYLDYLYKELLIFKRAEELPSVFHAVANANLLFKKRLANFKEYISALYHFTHINNLRSILEMGLVTKAHLEKLGIDYIENDTNRWDGVEDSISLSISHPNHKMFMKYAKPTGLENWVVLRISPELLSGNTNPAYKELENYDYLDKAIFNKLNAASFAMKNISTEERKSHVAFLDMFESNIGMTLETYTFDNQAEILYQGDIPKEFIQEIHVIEEDPALEWVEELGFKVSVNQTVFEKR
jgi:hypothetical protein